MSDLNQLSLCLRAKNALVDQGKAPENLDTYASCWQYGPTEGYRGTDNTKNCLSIYSERMQTGTLPSGVAYTDAAVASHCASKVAAIHPPETPWEWLSGAVSDIGDVVKTAAPFVQTVISFVPGIGTVASMAIGAGVALASGQPIDEIMVSAVAGAIPGGSIAAIGYKVGKGIIEGKPIEQLGIAILPIPDVAKTLLSAGADLTRKAANGENITKALVSSITAQLPAASKAAIDAVAGQGASAVADKLISEAGKYVDPATQKQLAQSIGTGIAVSHAVELQQQQAARIIDPALVQSFAVKGEVLAAQDPVVAASLAVISPLAKKGFTIGYAFTAEPYTPTEALALRTFMTGQNKLGFDAAVSLRNGKRIQSSAAAKTLGMNQTVRALVYASDPKNGTMGLNKALSNKSPGALLASLTAPAVAPQDALAAKTVDAFQRVGSDPSAQAGYLITQGMIGATPSQKAAIMGILAEDHGTREGASIAVDTVISAKQSWFDKLIHFLFG